MSEKSYLEIGRDMLAIIGAITILLLALHGAMSIGGEGSEENEPSDSVEINRFYSDEYHATDKDCSDFSSSQAAQVFYEESGSNDPHDLDRDGDGYACEWNL